MPGRASTTKRDMFRTGAAAALDALPAAARAVLPPGVTPLTIGPLDPAAPRPAAGEHEIVLAAWRLQAFDDYRAALAEWFALLRPGGHLVVTVPHAFLADRGRALTPPARRRYTPRALMEEVEEALPPNSYRVRWLGDDDRGYAYDAPPPGPAPGGPALVLVLERIDADRIAPILVDPDVIAEPDYAFEPSRTRIERPASLSAARILVLKLDHLGDFVMGIAALERLRAAFPAAEITLVVGSWNGDLARGLGVADRVIAFDAFPRDSSEVEVDVHGRRALFQGAVGGVYDLAIDLRTHGDTRFLLGDVTATLRCGLGTRAQFPVLDIFLPIDFTREEPETAREDAIPPGAFLAQDGARRTALSIAFAGAALRRDAGAQLWGPFHLLRAGDYLFEPAIELDEATPGILLCDVGLDATRVASATLRPHEQPRLAFTVGPAPARFEFRLWTVDNEPAPDFRFYGGRLIRREARSVLHQSEYLVLLVELIAMRVAGGLLGAGAGS